MKHPIKPLKQQTEFGCLATCFTMIKNHLFSEKEFNQNIESELTKQAFSSTTNFNEHHYLKKLYDLNCKIKVLVETPYMLEGYNLLNTKLKCKIPIEHCLIGVDDYESLLKEGYILITLIDLWNIDMIINIAHYVIVSGFDETSLYIIDPKYGKEIRISKPRFQQMLGNLKQDIKYSPLVFAIKNVK